MFVHLCLFVLLSLIYAHIVYICKIIFEQINDDDDDDDDDIFHSFVCKCNANDRVLFFVICCSSVLVQGKISRNISSGFNP